MAEINELTLLVFRDELRKLAAVNPRLGSAATLGVLGTLGGAGIGAFMHKRHPEDGESTLGAAARGAAIGGLGGASMGALLPEAARKAVSRFGLRELHAATGYMPEGESLRSLHAGSFPARAERVQAQRALNKAQLEGGNVAKAQKHLDRKLEAEDAARKAEEWGMTSLPGLAKSVKQHGLLPTMGRGFRAQMSGAHPLNKALMLGFPALGVAQALHDPNLRESGRSGEEVGYQGGQLVGGVLGGMLPFGVGQVLQEGVGRVGRFAGRGVDVVRGRIHPRERKEPPNPFRSYGPHPADSSDLTKAPGEGSPSETIMTARASGTHPESAV